MSSCFRQRPRAVTLIEVMVSQTIMLVVIAGIFSLLAGVFKTFHAVDGGTEAQIRLRQASHVMLRDLQALGGADGRAGELLTVTDATTGPDELSVFRTNPGVCAGGLPVENTAGATLQFKKDAGVCPVRVDNPTCTPDMLTASTVILVGENATMRVRVATTNAASCRIVVDNSSGSGTAEAVDALDNAFEPGIDNFSSLDGALHFIFAKGGAVRLGSVHRYRVAGDALERSIDSGAFEVVTDGVFDLQIARAYDINDDGFVDPNDTSEWVGRTPTVRNEVDLQGANARSFLGVAVTLVTFASSADGIIDLPRQTIENRTYPAFTGALRQRRYRTARFFMAARNRNIAN